MRTLILGGTVFLGRHVAAEALAAAPGLGLDPERERRLLADLRA